MPLLTASGLRRQIATRVILQDIQLAVEEGERIGVVGVNGSGKSTLLRILAGADVPDEGTLALRRGAVIGYLAQDPSLDESLSIRELLQRALHHHRETLEQYQAVSAALASAPAETADKLLAQLDGLQARLEHLGGYDLNHRIEQVLHLLGIGDPDRSVAGLSGGERKRVAIARALLARPDLLILDEPTNHLDADTTLWLEQELQSFPGAVVLVTHDRYFLDQVVHRIVEIEDGVLTSYPGHYDTYLAAKTAQAEQAARSDAARQNLLRTELEWLRRGPKARTTKSQSRIDRVEALQQEKGPRRREAPTLDFGDSVRLGHTILSLRHVTKSLGGRPLIRDLSVDLNRGDRLAIIGPNGAGKTTLLKLILGELSPDEGDVILGKNTVPLYFDQQREQLNPEHTIREEVADQGDYVEVGGQRRHIVSYLEDFLFPPGTLMMKIGMLSGGERNRVLLARLMKRPCNLLILDEPTNDLDLITMQVLEAALLRFPGCVLTVTHDRFFLNKVATGLLVFEPEGNVVRYEGDYDLYRKLRAQREEASRAQERAREEAHRARADAQATRPREQTTSSGTDARSAGRADRKLSWAERQELEKLPAQIEGLEAQQSALQTSLNDPALYSNPQRLREITQQLATLEHGLETLYERWQALEART